MQATALCLLVSTATWILVVLPPRLFPIDSYIRDLLEVIQHSLKNLRELHEGFLSCANAADLSVELERRVVGRGQSKIVL